MPKTAKKTNWVGCKLPEELIIQIDQIIQSGKGGYYSRQEFIIDAVRRRIEELLK
ncbi:MAG: hypothetical protein QW388_02350 [Thermoplasmatales archaeon]